MKYYSSKISMLFNRVDEKLYYSKRLERFLPGWMLIETMKAFTIVARFE